MLGAVASNFSSFGIGPRPDLIRTALSGYCVCVCPPCAPWMGGVHNTNMLQGIRIIHFLKKISIHHIPQSFLEMHMGENSERSTHLTQHQPQSRACV